VTFGRQLGLPFCHTQRYRAEDFLPSNANEAALAWLENPASWPGLRLAVYGEPGSGKTHLLHIFAARHGALFLPGAAVRQLYDLNGHGAVAIDDADAGPEPTALLHVLNMAAETSLPVLLSGNAPPAHWDYALPDLTSRLRATPVVGLGLPDDNVLRALLARLLAERQLAIPPALQDFMRLRLPRAGDAMREATARLDHAALAAGGKVTRGLVAAVLARMGCEDLATAVTTESIDQSALL